MLRTFSGHASHVSSIFLPPNSLTIWSSSVDGSIREWFISNASVARIISPAHNGSVRRVSGHVDTPTCLVSCGFVDGMIKIWSTLNGSLLFSFDTGKMLQDCVSSSNGRAVVVSTVYTNELLMYDVVTGGLMTNFTGVNSQIRRILMTLDDGLLYGASTTTSIVGVWNVTTGTFLRSIVDGSGAVEVYKGSVYVASATGVLRRYNATTGVMTKQFSTSNGGGVTFIAARNDMLFLAHHDGYITQWDIGDRQVEMMGSTLTPGLSRPTLVSSPDVLESGTSTSKMDNFSSISPDYWSPQTSFTITAIVLACFVLILLIILILVRYKKIRWRLDRADESNSHHIDTNLTTSSTHLRSVYTTKNTETEMSTTLMFSATELSIPAFLLKRLEEDFSLKNKLTRGGSAQIFECEPLDEEMLERCGGGRVVCKVITQQDIHQLSEPKQIAFYQELALMWRFRDHPNFVKVYAFSEQPAAFILKYYRWGDLGDFVHGRSRNPLPFDLTLLLATSLYLIICRTIKVMHESGYAHCDIKPANILLDLTPDGSLLPVLADFGISRVLDPNTLKVHAFEVSAVRGASTAYAAPETLHRFRFKYEERNPQIYIAGDVYALAITLLYILQRGRVWKTTRSKGTLKISQ